MTRAAIQLYTLRNLDESVPGLVERVGGTDIEGVEFAGLGEATPSAVDEAIEEAEATAVGAHVSLDHLENRFEEAVETYGSFGCDALVVPAVDAGCFDSPDAVDDLAARLSDLASSLDGRGMRLLYHNHAFEFTDLGGTPAYDRLVAATDDRVGFELDVGLATYGGADPVALLERHGDRIPLVHLTDTDVDAAGPTHADLGRGDVDVAACARAAGDAGAEWLVYEHGSTDDPEAALTTADAELARFLDDA